MWNDNYIIGIPPMDIQHKEIVANYEAVIKMIEATEVDFDYFSALTVAIQRLASTIIEHFQDEEALLAMKGYTKLETHKALHAEFLERLHKYVASNIKSHSLQVLNEETQYLLAYFIDHIQTADIKYLAVMM